MGYMVHHAIVVTSWKREHLEKARKMALAIFHKYQEPVMSSRGLSGLVSPIVSGFANDENSFFIAPDGSKEGWTTSDNGNAARKEFVDWLKNQDNPTDNALFLTWVEVQYGDEENHNRIVNASRN